MSYDFTDSRPIPRCDDCKSPLGDLGFCEECADRTEEPARTTTLCDDCAAALLGSLGPRIGNALVGPCACCQVDNQPIIQYEIKDRLPVWLAETPRIFCICGQPALIIEPHGTYCGACHEAVDLWRLWKEDSTEFVAELRRQSCRLNEMAVRMVVWLNAKNKSSLGTDSILAMWRQLLDDGDDPEPRFYVVARQQVAA